MDVALAVQQAVVVALRANGSFAAAATVWDRVPQGQAAPYVQIVSTTKQPWPAKRLGWEVTLTATVWTGTGSAQQALDIVALMDAVLDDTSTLAPTGYAVVRCFNEFTDTIDRGEDGVTRGAAVRYRIWVQTAP